ncbi:MAG: hypothetical protein U0169_21900 [Polyangiaceae bacterium]
MNSERRRSRARALGISAALVAGAVRFAGFCVLAEWATLHALLRTHGLTSITNVDPIALRIDFEEASSPRPGSVHAKNLRIRGSDTGVQWELHVDDVTFDAHPLALLRRRFRATNVHGDGVTMHLRQLVDDGTSADTLARLPPIPGFPGPPVRLPSAPLPPVTDEDYALWSVELEGVDATHVRDVWIDALRAEGDFRVRSRWFFRPLRWLEVGPGTVDVHEGRVSTGGQALAWDLGGTLATTVHGFDVRAPYGVDVLRHVSVAGELHGKASLGSVASWFAGGSDVAVAPCVGDVATILAVDRGRMNPGSWITARCPRARLDVGDLRVEGDFATSLHVDAHPPAIAPAGEPEPLSFLASRWTSRVDDARMTSGAIRARASVLRFDASSVLARKGFFGAERVDVAVEDAVVEGGSRKASAKATDLRSDGPSLAEGSLSFEGKLRSTGLRTTALGGPLAGSFAADVGLRGALFRSGAHVQRMAAAFDGTLARPDGSHVHPWTLRVTTKDGVLALGTMGKTRARVHVEATDASPLTEAIVAKTAVPRVLVDALSTRDLVVDGSFARGPDRFDVPRADLRSADLSASLTYARRGSRADGALLLVAPRLEVGVGLGTGPTELHLLGARDWFEKKVPARGSGTPVR